MKKKSLLAYQIGIGAICVFVVALLVIVLSQASGNKDDASTYNAANRISTSLNSYLQAHTKVPASLEAAGITNVPSSIAYTALTSTKYRFCVTYKTKSDNFDATNVVSGLLTSNSSQDGNSNSAGSSASSTLFIDSTHNKGPNCQVIDASNILELPSETSSTTELKSSSKANPKPSSSGTYTSTASLSTGSGTSSTTTVSSTTSFITQ